MTERIFDKTFTDLEKGIYRTDKVQEVIAHNIANAQTPGYVPKKFSEELDKAIEKSDKKNVNLEEEMADMARNSTEHSAYLKMMASKLAILRTIVTQGRK